MSDAQVNNALLDAGEGLFWERNGDQIRPFSPEVIHVGLEALWLMYWQIEELAGEAVR